MNLPPEAERPLIVTAWIDPTDLQPFNRLRERFFPPERNYLQAHVTLFHHIPGELIDELLTAIRVQNLGRTAVSVPVVGVFSMGRGVAYRLEADALNDIRQPLRQRFADRLTAQDLRPWKRPHITVQNKVRKEEAGRLLRHLQYRFVPCHVRVLGLYVHRYDGGPWTKLAALPFGE
ncbi:hypothetical protein LEM8419_01284 [Neolewinella maritima]|uniref:2'-5' RNA ligase family protein n=1 Tax=Neolewinella maritima TaxID=1383882 RepID=A0ABM9AZA9_9BACT|nr:2'-5' RNA ligase family protein [Neolewinella maritima]CAH1000137.1 hypothetical protein LEM8419_01284 [Neolewinella maritima]